MLLRAFIFTKMAESVSRKFRKLFGPEKPFVKLRTANSAGLVFSCVVNGKQLKHTAKFCASRRLRFEDTKRIMSPEKRPKSFGTFEKWVPGRKCWDSSRQTTSQETSLKTTTRNS